MSRRTIELSSALRILATAFQGSKPKSAAICHEAADLIEQQAALFAELHVALGACMSDLEPTMSSYQDALVVLAKAGDAA